MVVLLAVETVVVVLLALLVAGLLRSHAEILRRLEALDPEGGISAVGNADVPATSAAPVWLEGLPPARDQVAAAEAFDVVGTTLDGDAIKVGVGGGAGTLLAFLSSGCLTCHGFWHALATGSTAALSPGVRPVVVTKDPSQESPSRLRELAPRDIPLVMSSEAWDAYRVKGSPYFIHVGADGAVVGEGTATNWEQVRSLLRDAMHDAAASTARQTRVLGDSGIDRLQRADAELAAAGIHPGHPSLYGPNGPPVRADDA